MKKIAWFITLLLFSIAPTALFPRAAQAAYGNAREGGIEVFEVTLSPGQYILYADGQGDPSFSLYSTDGKHLLDSRNIDEDGTDGLQFSINNFTQTFHIWVKMNTCEEFGGCIIQVVTFNYDPARHDEDGWGYLNSDIERLERRPRY
ncbi:MAG: hypothetical protein AB8B99_22785 [Phormidesmis sp.]